jgi:tetraacyldisaccharide 4'-kinase
MWSFIRHGPGRSPLERYVRGSWGDPGPGLRGLAAIYGAVSDIRSGLWDAGVFQPVRLEVPVISVGGLTTGGSGKTPVTATLARHLADAGVRVAVVTPGQGDELRLHAEMNPDVPVSGGRWRSAPSRMAIADGADTVLLDSGFQHRRLHRDLDLVTCNVDQTAPRDRLPAGPYRERFTALRRADAVLLLRRAATGEQARALEEEVRGVAPQALVVHARFRADGLQPANAAATGREPDPAVAVAGIMWPETFFRWLPDAGVRPEHRIALPDHTRYDGRTSEHIAAAAGARGVVCTRKDAVRLAPALPADVPVWWLAESLEWGAAADLLLAGVRHLATGGAK